MTRMYEFVDSVTSANFLSNFLDRLREMCVLGLRSALSAAFFGAWVGVGWRGLGRGCGGAYPLGGSADGG